MVATGIHTGFALGTFSLASLPQKAADFDMGHHGMHASVEATPGLSEEERAAILGGNAAQLVGWH